jgi:hypothetical protein
MQLVSLRLGVMALPGAVLLAVAQTALWSGTTAAAQQAGTSGLSVSVDWADTGRDGYPNVRFSVTNAAASAKEYVGGSCTFLLNGRAQTTVNWFIGDLGGGKTAYKTVSSEDKSADFNTVRCRVSGGRNAR